MKSKPIILMLIILVFIISFIAYPNLPEQIPSHWNARGEVDGYMIKFWGLFLIPFMLVFISVLFYAIPYIDPLKNNIKKFRKYYDGFIIVFTVFMFYIFLLTILWNFFTFNMNQMIMPALGFLFFYLGILVENAKRNWFIGIRTPWTLSNDKVWDKTHELGGKLFKISAIFAFVGLLFGDYAIWFVLIPVIISSLLTVVYSYYVWRKSFK